jgi:hypothetical protein
MFFSLKAPSYSWYYNRLSVFYRNRLKVFNCKKKQYLPRSFSTIKLTISMKHFSLYMCILKESAVRTGGHTITKTYILSIVCHGHPDRVPASFFLKEGRDAMKAAFLPPRSGRPWHTTHRDWSVNHTMRSATATTVPIHT